MGAVRLPLSAAAAALITIGGSAAPALADDPGAPYGTVTVTPRSVQPGGDVQVKTWSCGTARAGTATSVAFVSAARLAPAHDDSGLTAEAVIGSTVTAGSYPVKIHCEGGEQTDLTTLVVLPVFPTFPHHHHPHHQSSHPAHHYLRPFAPVPAGGGGTAEAAADAGPSTGVAAILAAAGLAVAGTAGLVLHRRRRADTDRD